MHKAILFDFDGVLAKTMDDNFRAWQLAMRDFGAEILPEDYFLLEGMNVKGVAESLCLKKGITPRSFEEVVQKKEQYYFANHHFELYPGVKELILLLKNKNIPCAIVTAGRMDRLQKTAERSFLELFDAIITGDKTERGKPFPDPYLAGAREVGHEPGECIVVENAPLGIRAAKAAGAYCIAIASTMRPEHLHEADEIVATFGEIKQIPSMYAILQAHNSR